ncbi:MAG: M23 family metallopeptidase, partial [Acidobacteriota bacterium]
VSVPPPPGGLHFPLALPREQWRQSSSFGEDRGSHLHGGVDFSTGGKVGVPVLAVADGQVTRIKVRWRGLGRAIYVQHADGLMTVSGHLDGFAEPIASWVDAQLAKKGPFPGDLWPDPPFPVKAGEVIAYSGETGGGPPHLHFETRRSGGNRPVDPYDEGLACPDVDPPKIAAVAALPRDGGPAVVVHAPTLPDRPWETLMVPPGARLAARVEDPLGAGTGGPRRLVARLQSGEVSDELLRLDFGGFTFKEAKRSGHVHVRDEAVDPRQPCRGCWFWLHDLPGNDMKAVAGLADLPAGWPERATETTLHVEATDGAGLSEQVVVPLRSGHPRRGRRRMPAPRCLSLQVSVPSGALAEDLTLTCETLAGARLPHGVTPVGYPMKVGPAWAALQKEVVIQFPKPKQLPEGELGVYRFDARNGSWVYWGGVPDARGLIGATTDRLGTYALGADRSPPKVEEWGRRRRPPTPWRAASDEILVRYSESGEGLGWDAIVLELEDDRRLTAEIDPDRSEAVVRLPASELRRRVVGRLVLTDRAGLVTSVEVDAPAGGG